jgi:methylated-DNA-protein-cysteine methyltransferase-like protein
LLDDTSDNVQKILTVIRQIPKGKVATYGQIARLAGIPRNARQVGSVLRKLKVGANVPWFRVVNSKGEISQRGSGGCTPIQRQALEEENVSFDDKSRISLKQFGWQPDSK